ncbi:MAG: ATP synthase F1 subunit delta [Vulcanibacillus sp.]
MIEGLAAKRYAKALFELTKETDLLDRMEQDLQLIIKVIYDDEEIRRFLAHPQITREVKKKIIASALSDKILKLTKNMLFQLIDNNRQEVLGEILNQYVKLANIHREIIDVEAISVVSLNEKEKDRIAESFKNKFGKKVRLINKIDSSILGGMVIRIEDKVYDGSIKTKLQVMKRSLTTSRV